MAFCSIRTKTYEIDCNMFDFNLMQFIYLCFYLFIAYLKYNQYLKLIKKIEKKNTKQIHF